MIKIVNKIPKGFTGYAVLIALPNTYAIKRDGNITDSEYKNALSNYYRNSKDIQSK